MKITSFFLVRRSPEGENSKNLQLISFFPLKVDSTISLPLNSQIAIPGISVFSVSPCKPNLGHLPSELYLPYIMMWGASVFTGRDCYFSHLSSHAGRLVTLGDKGEWDVRLRVSKTLNVLTENNTGLWRRLSTEELMLLNSGVGEDSWESLGLQGDPTSPFWRRSTLGFLWKEWC